MSSYVAFNIVFIIFAWLDMVIEPYIQKGQRKYLAFLYIVAFSVLMALRPEDTKDTLNYINSFESMNVSSASGINLLQKYQGYEWGYLCLITIFKYFSSSYRLFFFLVAFVGTSLAVVGLKKICDMAEKNNKDYWGTVLALYISNFGMLYNGISVRAGLSMGIGVFAISLLLLKKYTKGVILLFLAFTIQRSAFLLAVIYLILRFMPVLRKGTYWILWAAAGIIMFSRLGVMAYNQLSSLIVAVAGRFSISGYAAFFSNADIQVGLRDIYLWLLYGLLILMMGRAEYYGKYLNVIMVASFVVATLYGVRAIARVYDIFYLFMIPSVGAIYMGRPVVYGIDRRLATYAVIAANAILMLRLCFL